MSQAALAVHSERWYTELMDWVSACQSAYHIDSTPNHKFAFNGGSNLEENRESLKAFVHDGLEMVLRNQIMLQSTLVALEEAYRKDPSGPELQGLMAQVSEFIEAGRKAAQSQQPAVDKP